MTPPGSKTAAPKGAPAADRAKRAAQIAADPNATAAEKAGAAAREATHVAASTAVTAGLSTFGVPPAVANRVAQHRLVRAATDAGVNVTARVVRVVVSMVAVLALLPITVIGVSAVAGTGGTNPGLIYQPDQSEFATEAIPEDVYDAYRAAGVRHRVPWTVLAALGTATSHGKVNPYGGAAPAVVTSNGCPSLEPPIGGDIGQGAGVFLLDLPALVNYELPELSFDDAQNICDASDVLAERLRTAAEQYADDNDLELNTLTSTAASSAGDNPDTAAVEKLREIWGAALGTVGIVRAPGGDTCSPATTSNAPTATPATTPVVAVGDSVLLGAETQLRSRLGVRLEHFDAVVSRRVPAGLEALRAVDVSGKTVVWAMGNNYSSSENYQQLLDQALAHASGASRIVLVSVSNPNNTPDADEVNRVNAAVAERNPKVDVVDWGTATAFDSNLTAGDGLHLSPAGATALSGKIADTLAGAPAPSGASAGVGDIAGPESVGGAIVRLWGCELADVTLHTMDSHDNTLDQTDAASQLVTEALGVAWAHSEWGQRDADPTACTDPARAPANNTPYGVFPLTQSTFDEYNDIDGRTRCDPEANIAAAARAVASGEAVAPGERNTSAGTYAVMFGGWARLPGVLGDNTATGTFASLGPPARATFECSTEASRWVATVAPMLDSRFAALATNPAALDVTSADALLAAYPPPDRSVCPPMSDGAWLSALLEVTYVLVDGTGDITEDPAQPSTGPGEATTTTTTTPSGADHDHDQAVIDGLSGLAAHWQRKLDAAGFTGTAQLGVDSVIPRLSYNKRVPPAPTRTPRPPSREYERNLLSFALAYGGVYRGDTPVELPTGGVATGGMLGAGVPFADIFNAAGAQHGVDPRLLAAVAKAESGFRDEIINCSNRSTAGAMGVMQFMPGTARGFGIDPCDPNQAIPAAAQYLRGLHDQFGEWDLALAGYNWGQGNVRKNGRSNWPGETSKYVPKVMGFWDEFKTQFPDGALATFGDGAVSPDVAAMIEWGRTKIGITYSQCYGKWAHMCRNGENRFGSPYFDCSGFVSEAYKRLGLSFGQTTSAMYSNGALRATQVPFDFNQMQPGDIFLTRGKGHVGIYTGNGMVLHSTPPRLTEEPVPERWRSSYDVYRPLAMN